MTTNDPGCAPVLAVLFVAALVSFVIGVMCGNALGESSGRANAVEAGVARYEIDPQSGVSRFVYIAQEALP